MKSLLERRGGGSLLEEDYNPLVAAGELVAAGGALHAVDKHFRKPGEKSPFESLAFPWMKEDKPLPEHPKGRLYR